MPRVRTTFASLVAVSLAVVGCGGGGSRDAMEADTARFSWGQRSATTASGAPFVLAALTSS